ncbi:MAG: M14-type cytosolic carboxypeptidase [Chlorobi bacterium]|nr:M14-type cytosolic carboxypeptidase [Chlorobiota bacterium]MCI0715490.1 M14-type cytosolic carboxypeptidase [Chlorobiota bacterium]
MMFKNVKYKLSLVAFISLHCISLSQISVDTSFEGANAKVITINNLTNTVKIESKLRTGDVHNVVFYCKISGFNVSQPFKIQVKYTQQYYVPVLAAYSYDKINWFRFTGTFIGDSKEFTRTYSQNTIYFSHGYPYVYSDLINLETRFLSNPFVSVSNIALSQGGKNVKLFKFTEPCVPDTGKYSIWVIGRNHAMESHSNYVIEGLCDFMASSNVKADRLRRLAIVYVVPVMDVDNTAIGGTGKDQLPVDFNRDWDSPSYWAAVIAVKQKIIETSSQNPLKIFIDSHNPFPGQNDNNTWFYSRHASGVRSVNLDFYRKLLLENGGYVFNRLPAYATNGQTSAAWVDSMFSSMEFSTSLETGWVNRTDNVQWTLPLYKTHGEVLGKGMCDYINNILKPGDIILDNTDTLNGVTITGQWTPSTFTPGYWSVNYIHDGNTGQGTKSVRYSPFVQNTGYYEVFLRWTSETNRALNVPVKITFEGGIKDTVVNQRAQGGEWVALGIFRFNAGSSGNILVSNTGTNGFVIADAIRLSLRNYCNPISVQNIQVPAGFSLSVYPNPFNPTTNIKLALAKNSFVVIKIYDIEGREVRQIVNNHLPAGEHNYVFNGEGLSSGVYFYTATVQGSVGSEIYSYSGKLVLIK